MRGQELFTRIIFQANTFHGVWRDLIQYVLSPPFHSPLMSLCIGVPVTNHLFSACNCRHISAALVVSLSTIWASSTQSYVHLSYIHTRGGNTRVKVRYVRTCAHVNDATPVPIYIHTYIAHTHTYTQRCSTAAFSLPSTT